MQSDRATGRWRTLAFTSLGHLVNDGSQALIPVAADIFATGGHLSLMVVTFMSLAFYISSAAPSFFIGHIADKNGDHGRMISLGIGIFSGSFVLFYLSSLVSSGELVSVMAVCGAVMAGVGSAFYHPLGSTMLQRSFTERMRGKALGFNGAFGGVGSSIFPIVFFSAAALYTQTDAFISAFLICAVSAVALWAGLRARRGSNGAAGTEKPKMRDVFTKGIVLLAAITAVRSVSTTGFTFWLPTYITTVRGGGIGTTLGLTLALLYAAAIPGQPVFGVLADRFDKRLVLGVSSAGSSLAVLGYIYLGGPAGLVMLALFGFFTFTNFPILLTLAAEYVPDNASSAGGGLVWGLGAAGGNILGPAMVGVIIGNQDSLLSLAFSVVAAVGLAGALLTPFTTRPTRPVAHETAPSSRDIL